MLIFLFFMANLNVILRSSWIVFFRVLSEIIFDKY
jgi:hypothetical protein